ncbi:neurogenic locus notch homolog protein 2-like [Physella acuta]|uniref:neurogenic locus notch homolog protein 2-like n=1 Tax=Physella acuta TaxID=109671 RepID=UPI0027DC94CC|nr:neurogenic locus notch homolog protein 2-like [Physella acuta]
MVRGRNVCSCRPGYVVNPTNPAQCLDINECNAEPSPCQQICINTDGSFTCSCKPGFAVNSTDPTMCDALCVPLASAITETRPSTSAQECYATCRAERCYSFKFFNGECSTRLFTGDVVNVSISETSASSLTCYNETTQCTVYNDAGYRGLPATDLETCVNTCRDDAHCFSYTFLAGFICILTYATGALVDLNVPIDQFLFLDCAK